MKDLKSGLKKTAQRERTIEENEPIADGQDYIPKEIMSAYGGKSRGELMNELRREYQNGSFDRSQLEAFAHKLSPMLDAETRRSLEDVLKLTDE